MKQIFFILGIILSTYAHSKSNSNQVKEYVNDKLGVVENENQATYYILYQPDTTFTCYYLDGKKFLTGKWFERKSAKLDDCCVWYLKDGNVDTEQCFENGEYKRPIITVKHKQNAWNGACNECVMPRNDKNLIEWDTVVNLAGSSDILYEKAKLVLKSFESLGQKDNDLKANDDQKNVTRRLSIPFSYVGVDMNTLTSVLINGSLIFNTSIYCKDNRYKIKFNNFIFVPNSNNGTITLEEIYNLPSSVGQKNPRDKITKDVVYTIEGYPISKKQEAWGLLEKVPYQMSLRISDLRKKSSGQDVTNEKW